MFNGFRSETVAELQAAGILRVEDGNHGNDRPRPEEFGRGNTAFIRAADLEDGRVLFESADKISDIAVARIRKGKGRPGDILFSSKGTVGKLAMVRMDAPPFVCSPQTTFWRTLDENQLDRSFLYAYMQSSSFTRQWRAIKSDTDMADYASLTSQREFRVPLPRIEFQHGIASVFQPLNDKIESNRRMNRTLEELASRLFRSWFVDFDPVVAKGGGREPAHLSVELAKLFPSNFQVSALGPIPQGWQVMKVNELVERINVGKKYEQKTTLPKGRIPILDQGRSGLIGYHNDEPGVTASMEEPVAVFANHTCYSRLLTYPFSAIQNVLPFKGKGVSTVWLFYATDGLQEFIEYKGHWPDLMDKEIVVPSDKLDLKFEEAVRPFIAQTRHNERESETLAVLRDTLLPKLLSGEVCVKQAEKLFAAAS
jgi:type I restriction enzyme S subunit